MKKIIFSSLLFLSISCCYATQAINVVASFSILGDLVKSIGGDKVNLITIVGPNQDTHEYEIKPSDVDKINQSQILFINGLGLENGWINQLIKSYKGHVVVVTTGLKPLTDNSGMSNSHKIDPHAWNDVQNVKNIYIPNILNALVTIDPKNKIYYQKNAKNYIAKLTNLNQWAINQLNQVPLEHRQAVTTHDAFAYFALAYKVNFISVQGVSTDSDASARDVAIIENAIKKSKVKVVFLENMTNNQLINQIAKDTGAKIGGQLYSDALSDKSGSADTYINLIRSNIHTLVTAWK